MGDWDSELPPGDPFPGDDFDLDAYSEWSLREIDAGRLRVPSERELAGPAVSLSLGDASDIDPVLLAAIGGPDGLGGQSLSAVFGQDQAADVLRPGPVLAVLTAERAAQAGSLSDDELTGILQAGRRLAALAEYQQTVAVAELARRRQAQFEAARASGKPAGCRDGEFPGQELAMELVETAAYAETRIETAVELTSRLPRTLAGMAAGTIDLTRAAAIALHTVALSDADAAYADEVLAEVAAARRPDQLARKAAALELKLAPEVVRARKEAARQLHQRVEIRREGSGNASLAGRELDPAEALASEAHLSEIAARLRNSGVVEGTLPQLRALAMLDLTQGRNPLDRIQPHPAPADAGPAAGAPPAPGRPAPLPALINLLVPASTLLGFGAAPAQAGRWGLLDSEETRTVVRAASQHPRARWCLTVTAPDGTAVAHGCAPGRHPWGGSPAPPEDSTGPPQLLELLRALNLTLKPVARDTCGHGQAENRYAPGRGLRHLIRARTQTCSAPGCNAQAVHCDLDHGVPYPDGPTCQCNLDPKCRRHHRTKQAPGWHVEQATPDTSAWTTPATHTSGPTVYDQ